MADKILSRKGDIIRDQMECGAGPLDSNDPIYDSEAESDACFYRVIQVGACDYRSALNNRSCFSTSRSPPLLTLAPEKSALEFEEEAKELLREFFNAPDPDSMDLTERLRLLDCAPFHDAFVVYATREALNRSTDDQRRLSAEFALLHDKGLITRQQLCRAFEKLVQSTDEIEVNVPDAAGRLFAFMECASLDGCIEPDVLSRLPSAFVAKLDPAVVASTIVVQAATRQMQEFKVALSDFLKEVFNTQGVEEAREFLISQDKPLCQHEFVSKLVVASYSREAKDRELASNVLDRLYGKLLKPDDLQVGFSRLVGAVDDLALDVPQAHDFLAKSLARAVVDELLPPAFLRDRYRLHFGGAGGMQVLRTAQKWLCEQSGRAACERFRKIWTGTDPSMRDARIFKFELKSCIYEYLESLDAVEAARAINEMDLTPDQDTEVVRKLHIFAMEKCADKDKCADAVVKLLKQLQLEGEVDQESIIAGLSQIRDLLSDIELDVPDVRQKLAYIVASSKTEGLLPIDYVFEEEDSDDGTQ